MRSIKKVIFSASLVLSLGLAACGEETVEETKIDVVEETPTEETVGETKDEELAEETKTWTESLDEIINSSDAPSDKFYSLEKIMMNSEVSEDEIKSFKQEILSTYKDKTYLTNPNDDKVMLNLIFKSYIVEQNETNEWKDFAFDFHQNVKYVYRGVDAPDSASVKANENQMNKVINALN